MLRAIAAAAFILIAGASHAEQQVFIDNYRHAPCQVAGKPVLPVFSFGGRASFWLPRQREECRATVARALVTCEWATRLPHGWQEEAHPECAAQFKAQIPQCVYHYRTEGAKCEVDRHKRDARAGRWGYIQLFKHESCTSGGKRFMPLFARDGSRAYFRLPEQRSSCMDAMATLTTSCLDGHRGSGVRFSSDLPEVCGNAFSRQVRACEAHYEKQFGLCEGKMKGQVAAAPPPGYKPPPLITEEEVRRERERLKSPPKVMVYEHRHEPSEALKRLRQRQGELLQRKREIEREDERRQRRLRNTEIMKGILQGVREGLRDRSSGGVDFESGCVRQRDGSRYCE